MATDEELGALDAGRRMTFRAELQKRQGDHSPLTDDEASPIVAESMQAIGLTDPRQ